MPAQSTLTADEKVKIKNAIPTSSNKIFGAALARLYYAYPDPKHWSYTGLQGAVVLSQDNDRHCVNFKLIDIDGTRGIIWEHELWEGFELFQDRAFFHSFSGDECMIGFVYADEQEAKAFSKKVNAKKDLAVAKKTPTKGNSKKKKIGVSKGVTKYMISGPQPGTFQHVAHMGYDAETGFSSKGIDSSWLTLLEGLEGKGVSREVIAKDMEFIRTFVEQDKAPKQKSKPPPPPAPIRRSIVPNTNGGLQELPSPPPPVKRTSVPPAPPAPLRQVQPPQPPVISQRPSQPQLAPQRTQPQPPVIPQRAQPIVPPPAPQRTQPQPPPAPQRTQPQLPPPTPQRTQPQPPPTPQRTQPSSPVTVPEASFKPPVPSAPPRPPLANGAPPPPPIRPTSGHSVPHSPSPPTREVVPPPIVEAAPPPPPPPPPPQSLSAGSPPPPPPPPAPATFTGSPPPPGGSGPPSAMPSAQPERDGLLASIRQSGGIGSLRKTENTSPRESSNALAGAAVAGGAAGAVAAEATNGSGGDLTSALAAALMERNKRLGDSDSDDDDDDDDEWD